MKLLQSEYHEELLRDALRYRYLRNAQWGEATHKDLWEALVLCPDPEAAGRLDAIIDNLLHSL